LAGASYKSLSEEFNLPTKTVKQIIDNPEARLLIEKQQLTVSKAKESRRIDEIKSDILEFITASLKEAMDGEKKIVFIDKVSKLLDTLDRIARLNRGEVTDNTAHTEKRVEVDVAKVIAELKTPEQKKEYLRQQLIIQPEE
jgi:hypothetical protein